MSKIDENVTESNEVIYNETEPNPKYHRRNPFLFILHSLQRLSLVAGMLFLTYVFWSSFIYIETPRGDYIRYSTLNNINVDSYEESWLFNDTIRCYVNDILRLGAIRSQIEKNGVYDTNKAVNISSYASNIGKSPASFPDIYYQLGHLLNWSQHGFSYERILMTTNEFKAFLNPDWTPDIIESSGMDNEQDTGLVVESHRIIQYPGGSVDLDELSSYGYNVIRIFSTFNEISTINPWAGSYIQEIYVSEGEIIIPDYLDVEMHVEYEVDDNDIDEIVYSYTIEQGESVFPIHEYVYVLLENGQIVLLDSILSEIELAKERKRWAEQRAETQANMPQSYLILNNLYQTISRKNIENYASNYDTYMELCRLLESSAYGLSADIALYDKLQNSIHNSNIYYAILVNFEGNEALYTNFDFNLNPLTLSNAGDYLDNWLFNNFERYLKYTPNYHGSKFNVNIDEAFIRFELSQYSTFPYNTRVWIGVDTNYPYSDAFYQGYRGFHQFFPKYISYLIQAGICFLIFIILLVVLTKLTGRVAGEDGKPYIQLRSFDRIFTEIWLALAFATVLVLLHIAEFIVNNSSIYGLINYSDLMFNFILMGGYVYVWSLAFSLFYYSLVRRIKAGSFIKDSLFMRLVIYSKKIFHSTIKLILYIYDNTNLMLRYVVPSAAIIFFHFFAIVVIANSYNGGVRFFFAILVLSVDAVVGILIFLAAKARVDIIAGIKKISSGDIHHKVEERGLHGDNLILANAVNSIGESISTAVEISMRDERLKADLITNVSHDIKTPLTSIINYVDLIKREDITNETVKNYVDILETKSQRLKQLTDDLVEASKISSGNIEYKMEKIDLTELVNQTIGEFEDKFNQRNLQINLKANREELVIEADSRRIWRVIENLFNNIYKYAMSNTRVYIELNAKESGHVELSIKNISEQPLNFNADELTERFIRGDVSRSTEGSGLGLSIAKSLTEAQNGRFEILMDGDLFKVVLTFPLLKDV